MFRRSGVAFGARVIAVTTVAFFGGALTVQAETTQPDIDKVAASLHSAIMDFCRQDFTAKQLFARFAPEGAIKMGEGNLPVAGKPSYIETDILVTLHTTDPATRVVWWIKPKEPKSSVQELTIVPDTSARIVDYDWFLKKYGIPAGTKQPQTHPLSDIPHAHVISCGQTQVKAIIQQIVWADPHIGKIGDIVLKK